MVCAILDQGNDAMMAVPNKRSGPAFKIIFLGTVDLSLKGK